MKEVIYIDTCSLLLLYTFPVQYTKDILDKLDKAYGSNIIIPERVAFEFDKNKSKYLNDSKQTYYQQTKKIFDDQIDCIRKSLKKLSLLDNVDSIDSQYSDYLTDLEIDFRSISNSMSKEVDKMKSLYKEKYDIKHDVISDFVNNHKSKQHLTLEEKLNLVTKALARQKVGIKPGLTDIDKPKDKKDLFKPFGDYFIWYEVLKNVDDVDTVIFISEENKNDYWENKDKTIFDYVLIEEFNEINNNKKLKGYHLIDFILEKKLNLSSDTLFFINKENKLYNNINENFDSYIYEAIDELPYCVTEDDFDCVLGEPVLMGSLNSVNSLTIKDKPTLLEPNNIGIEANNGIVTFKYKTEIKGTLKGSELQMHDEDLGDICESVTAEFKVNANIISYFKINHLLKEIEYDYSSIELISDTFCPSYSYVNEFDEEMGDD